MTALEPPLSPRGVEAPAMEARAMEARAMEALAFEAPYLIEKLVKDCIAETPDEAERLFTEVKRYMIIAALDRSRVWHMYSLLIDECWHQFILFTHEYMDFCRRYFGRYVPHAPSNAPEVKPASPAEQTTFKQFAEHYQAVFGLPLPGLWRDADNVTPRRRVVNSHAGSLTVREEEGEVALVNRAGNVVLSVNDLARDALAFIAATGAFYVRELPGDLDEEEKVALASALVECKVLRLAS
jgi:hypothetical protein